MVRMACLGCIEASSNVPLIAVCSHVETMPPSLRVWLQGTDALESATVLSVHLLTCQEFLKLEATQAVHIDDMIGEIYIPQKSV